MAVIQQYGLNTLWHFKRLWTKTLPCDKTEPPAKVNTGQSISAVAPMMPLGEQMKGKPSTETKA